MSGVIQLFFALGIIIALAKASGYLATHLGQPAVLGELIAGVIIGPSILNLLQASPLLPDGSSVEHTIIEIAEIGVLFLMFSAGLEIDLPNMLKVGRTALVAGVLGVIFPILVTIPSAALFGYALEVSLFIGLILAATSVSISAQVMLELGVLGSREGLALLGAAVVDDVLVILLISLFLAVNPGGLATTTESRSIIEVVVRLVGFLTIASGLSWWLLPRIATRIHRTSISEGVLVVAIVASLLIGFAAEFMGGIAAITGAFIAGICLGQADRRIVEDIEQGFHRLNYGFFVPIFFVSIGLQANLRLLGTQVLPFAILLIVGATVSKIIGAGLGGILTGFSGQSALRLGIGMVSRGEVGLIVAALGISSGIISEEIFSAIVLVVIVTTIVTPPLVRWSFAGLQTPKTRTQEGVEAS